MDASARAPRRDGLHRPFVVAGRSSAPDRFAGLLACAERRDAASSREGRCGGQRSVTGSRSHAQVVQSYESARQHPNVGGTTVPSRSAPGPRPLLPPRWSGVLVSQVNVTTPGRFACAASHGGVRARARSTDGGRGCTQVRRSRAASPRTRGSGLRRPWPIRRFDSRAVGSKAEGELCTDEANMARIVSRDASTRTPGAMVPLAAGPLAATGPALVCWRARTSDHF